MDENLLQEYRAFDRPEVLSLLFYPRREAYDPGAAAPGAIIAIPVEQDVEIGAQFFRAGDAGPAILFFHGNGEIVSDYNDMGPLYSRMGIHFFPVDYRGYGRSGGRPTVSAMMRDCHTAYRFARQWLRDAGIDGPLLVMGRSLGSASAVELAATYPGEIRGLIIESGFAHSLPLLRFLGVDTEALGLRREGPFQNIDKIRRVPVPTLIIHAVNDQIIPYSDARALYEQSGATAKKLITIPMADHNTIFYYGFEAYMRGIREFVASLDEK